MAVRKYILPAAQMPIADGDGKPTRVWHNYLSGVQDVSGRVAAVQSDLAASPTVEQISTAFNALLAAMKAAKQMESS